jgi:hypothetical protein
MKYAGRKTPIKKANQKSQSQKQRPGSGEPKLRMDLNRAAPMSARGKIR